MIGKLKGSILITPEQSEKFKGDEMFDPFTFTVAGMEFKFMVRHRTINYKNHVPQINQQREMSIDVDLVQILDIGEEKGVSEITESIKKLVSLTAKEQMLVRNDLVIALEAYLKICKNPDDLNLLNGSGDGSGLWFGDARIIALLGAYGRKIYA